MKALEFYNVKGEAEIYFAAARRKKEGGKAEDIAPDRLSQLPENLRPKNGLLVDLGCGPGNSFLKMLKVLNFQKVLAVDGSPNMIKFIDEEIDSYLDRGRVRLTLQVADLQQEKINTDSGSADLVSCFRTFYHLESLDNLLKEVGRILKPDGLFVFDAYNKDGTETVIKPSLEYPFLNFLHPTNIVKEVAQSNGLDLLSAENIGEVRFGNRWTSYWLNYFKKI